MTPSFPLRKSELRRRLGIQLKRRYGLIRCKCKNHLIARRGQQTRLCPRCGRRFWLHDYPVIVQSDGIGLIQKFLGGKGNYYRPDVFIPADEVLAHRTSQHADTSAWSVRTRRRLRGRERELVAT